MRPSRIGLLSLLVLGYGLALWAARPTDERPLNLSALMSIEPASVVRVIYKRTETDSDFEVVVEKNQAGNFWVEQTTRKKEGEPPAILRFKANQGFQEYVLQSFYPLETKRVLGNLLVDELTEYDLVEPKEFLELETTDGSIRFEIGLRNFYSPFVFMKNQDGLVFLTGSNPKDYMANPIEHMFERLLTTIQEDDVDSAIVSSATESSELEHTRKNKKGEVVWSKGEETSFVYDTWMKQVSRLRVASYATEDEQAKLQDLSPMLTINYRSKGEVIETINFFKIEKEAEPATELKANDDDEEKVVSEYWARSTYSEVPVRLFSDRMATIANNAKIIVQ